MHGGAEGRRRGPWGLVGAIGMALAVEAVVARHDLDLTTPARMEWRQSGTAATEKATGCAVLGLGTSMTKLGLMPAVLGREAGARAYNLASCAGRLPGAYYLLRRALGAGARPGAVVLEVHPTYLATPFQEGLTAWPDLLGPAECLDLARTAGDAEFVAATLLARALPTLRARAEIRAVMQAALRGESGSNRPHTRALLRNLDRNDGAFVGGRNAAYRGEVSPHLEAMYLPPSWSCHPVNALYLRRILDLCRDRDIRAFWLIPPLAPALQERREQRGLDAAYTRFAERVQRAYPGLVVLDARRSGYEASAFSDAAHLDLDGAVSLSAAVGRLVKAGPPRPAVGGRWIDLPAYRDRPIEARFEEIAQSYRATAEPSGPSSPGRARPSDRALR